MINRRNSYVDATRHEARHGRAQRGQEQPASQSQSEQEPAQKHHPSSLISLVMPAGPHFVNRIRSELTERVNKPMSRNLHCRRERDHEDSS